MINGTVCVFDGGHFVDLATALAAGFNRVLYQCSIDLPYPKVHEAVIGEGIPEIERIDDFWEHMSEIDLFVFPDCAHAGLQNELVRQGKLVWGSRDGVFLELNRREFKKELTDLGLPVGQFTVIQGLDNLRSYLRGKKDKWIKISKFRGCCETWHWIDWETSKEELDHLAITFGSVADEVAFIVEDSIPTKVEWGYDGYFSGGRFPNRSAHGPEVKDKCYLSSIVDFEKLPKPVRETMETVAPLLAKNDYTNFISAELRITEDGTAYFTDPTCRCPWPASACQFELYKNLPEIIWGGAQGDCVDPVTEENFAVEIVIDHKGDDQQWRRLVVPDPIKRWVKLAGYVQVGKEAYAFPPLPHSFAAVGSIIGLGKTIDSAIAHLKDNISVLGDQPVEIRFESLIDGLKELHEAKDQGIKFTGQKIPEPASIIEDDDE